jgi:hypothetical protein
MTTTTTADTTTNSPAPAPTPAKATTAPTTITLRHPGLDGYAACGEYLFKTDYIFNTQTDAELIAALQRKGFAAV